MVKKQAIYVSLILTTLITACSTEELSSITTKIETETNIETQLVKPKPTASSKVTLSAKEVYNWVQNRYDYYDELLNNGDYSGDKYEKQVFQDAARHFYISQSEVRKLYNLFRY